MIQRFRNTIEYFKSLSKEDLEAYRYLLIILIVADMIGVYWYFQWKRLGLALLIVLIMFFALILFAENSERRKETENEKEKTKENTSQ